MATHRRLVEAGRALATGTLLAAALPPSSHSPLVWCALVPLLSARAELPLPRLATLAALAILPPLWTVGTMLGLLGIPVPYRIGVLLGVPTLCAAGTAIGLVMERRLAAPILRALVFPGLVTAIEGMLRIALPAIPVPSLAWSQRPDGLLIHVGLALGTPLPVTFLIVLTNVGIADGIRWLRDMWRSTQQGRPFPVAATLAVLTFVSNLAFGVVRASTAGAPGATATLEKGRQL